ncbi:MAG: 50S ribosomal protein P1 [Candidatus Micrarchaeota archaeon]|nr:50S ribosomal protein P1 [Candidatus Micrarchaeota archaeon]
MEYTYAAMLLHSTKQPISEENLKKVLSSAGAKVDETRVKALVAALEGVNIEEAIKQAAMPVAAAPAAGEAKKEEKKEGPSEAEKEAEAAAGLSALFG